MKQGGVPKHVAIIMDGNRRWAKQHGLPFMEGHFQGAQTITRIVKAAIDLNIRVLTIYAFSTENWNRPPEEIAALMELYKVYLQKQKEPMVRDGVRLGSIGDLSRIPGDVLEALDSAKKATESCKKLDLVLALNYGGRDDIRRAALNMLRDHRLGKIQESDVSEERFAAYLDTAAWQDPQLLIRTSGEMRLSNFLLWQLSYAEIYVSEKLWPDFDAEELGCALNAYKQRDRRLGG